MQYILPLVTCFCEQPCLHYSFVLSLFYFYCNLFQYWPRLEAPVFDHFVTFPTDARLYQRPVTSVSAKNIKVSVQIGFNIILHVTGLFHLICFGKASKVL